jgi:hypothetical protein
MMFAQEAILIATFRVAGIGAGSPELDEQLAAAPALAPEALVCMARSQDRTGSAPKTSLVAMAPDRSSLDGLRPEIRQRVVFFQACGDAASRRGVLEVRRLYVTWTIAPDGSVTAMKLEGVMDPEMAACVARAGSRRFPIAPGTELTVPVPIVFVR